MFVVEEVAFKQIIIHPHKNVQLHVQVFEPHSNIRGSHSGIKVGMELSPQHLDPVIGHLVYAVSLVEQSGPHPVHKEGIPHTHSRYYL